MAKAKKTSGKKPKKSAVKKSTPKKAAAKKSAAKKPTKSAAPKTASRTQPDTAPETDIFQLRSDNKISKAEKAQVHIRRPGIICATEQRSSGGSANGEQTELMLDASGGFIPLWASNTTLNWQFNELSLLQFANPEAVKIYVRELFEDACKAWGPAAPVQFAEDETPWDFEIVLMQADECIGSGCYLASAFFPDSGRHELNIYPKSFTYSREEQIETLAHEIGHIFGLRHYFADTDEAQFRSELFGTHASLSIMNYGDESHLTDTDRNDLQRLYQEVWSGGLTELNGVLIRQVKPYSTMAPSDTEQLQLAAKRQKRAAHANK